MFEKDTLTKLEPFHNIPQDDLKRGGIIMKGIIICNKCRKKMDGVCSCGGYKCLIKIFWNGKSYEYRRDDQGYVFTYDKARDKLIEVSNTIKNHTFNPVDFTDANIKERKFENQIEKWLQGKEKRESLNELSPGTLRDYKGYVNNHYSFFHNMDVREITLEQLTNFKDTLDKISIKTRKNILNALRNFFFWLKERGVIKDMPIFPKIKGDDAKTRQAIDVELQDEVLQKIPDIHKDIIEFLFETGLRPGEACALLMEHIDARHNMARIERTFSGNKLRTTTKQKRKRNIPLSYRAYEIAQKHTQDKLPKQYLFINFTTKKNYLPDTLWRIWDTYSGLDDITLYEGTRHSFGSQLIQNNDVTIVKELMGHSDIKTTEKYLHMKMTRLENAVNNRKIVKLVRTENRTETEPSLQVYESNNIR